MDKLHGEMRKEGPGAASNWHVPIGGEYMNQMKSVHEIGLEAVFRKMGRQGKRELINEK